MFGCTKVRIKTLHSATLICDRITGKQINEKLGCGHFQAFLLLLLLLSLNNVVLKGIGDPGPKLRFDRGHVDRQPAHA